MNREGRSLLILICMVVAMSGVFYSKNVFAAIVCSKVESLDDSKLHVGVWTKNSAEATKNLTDGKPKGIVSTMNIRTSDVDLMSASWQSELLAGTATFIKDRAEKEIVRWYTAKMLDYLCDDTNSMYFRSTCDVKKSYEASLFPYGKELYRAMGDDLNMLPGNYICNTYNGSAAGYLLTNVLLEAAKKNESVMLLAQLGEKTLWEHIYGSEQKLDNSFDQMIYISSILLQATLVIDSSDKKNIAYYTIGKLNNDKLLSEKDLQEITKNLNEYVSSKKIQEVYDDIIYNINEINNSVKYINDLKLQLNKDNTSAILEEALKISILTTKISKEANVFIANQTDQIYENNKNLLDIVSSLSTKKYSNALKAFSNTICTVNEQAENKKTMCKYLPIVSSLAEAKSSNEVQAVLDTAASPVGAWMMKRQTPLIYSVGALAGISSGVEYVANKSSFGGGWMMQIFAPVGLDINWEPSKCYLPDGMFISTINIGNLLSARLSKNEQGEENASVEPDVKFANVISPGVYFRRRLANTPFVFALGGSYKPKFRKISDANSSSNFDVFTVEALIAVDITIFPIY